MLSYGKIEMESGNYIVTLEVQACQRQNEIVIQLGKQNGKANAQHEYLQQQG